MHVVDLDAFYEAVRSHNPFLDCHGKGSIAGDADVPAVHRAAFERLVELAAHALRGNFGLGVLLSGEPGVGKSHLLGRLRRWAARDDRACYACLTDLHAAPERLPCSIRRTVLSLFTDGRSDDFDNTPLFHLIHAGVNRAVSQKLQHYGWGTLESLFLAWLDAPTPAERTAGQVLFRFFKSVVRVRQRKEDGNCAVQAARWLAGYSLGPAETRGAGLPPCPVNSAAGEHEQQLAPLLALSRLAGLCGRPFILALDQWDYFEHAQASALAGFFKRLLERASNLLHITIGTPTTLTRWREQGLLNDETWARLAQFEVQLEPVIAADALQIVAERLRRVIEPHADLPAVQECMQDDLLFPLGRRWKDRYLADGADLRPRDVLQWAAAGWRAEQQAIQADSEWLKQWSNRQTTNGPCTSVVPTDAEAQAAIDRCVADQVAACHAWRVRGGATLPPDDGHLDGLLFSLLGQWRAVDHSCGICALERQQGDERGHDRPGEFFVVHRQTETGCLRTGVLTLTTTSPSCVANALGWLTEQARSMDRLLLVTDERFGLPLGAKGLEYLHALEALGTEKFHRVNLALDEYMRLDALQAVVALARAGDLEIEHSSGAACVLTECDVIHAHQRLNQYRSCRIVREIVSPGNGAS